MFKNNLLPLFQKSSNQLKSMIFSINHSSGVGWGQNQENHFLFVYEGKISSSTRARKLQIHMKVSLHSAESIMFKSRSGNGVVKRGHNKEMFYTGKILNHLTTYFQIYMKAS
jgi:hypothetical protein